MELWIYGIIAFGVMLSLLALRVPISFALGGVAVARHVSLTPTSSTRRQHYNAGNRPGPCIARGLDPSPWRHR